MKRSTTSIQVILPQYYTVFSYRLSVKFARAEIDIYLTKKKTSLHKNITFQKLLLF